MYTWQTEMLNKMAGMKPGELKIIAMGRQAGKSALVSNLYNQIMYPSTKPPKILWQRLPGNKLKAYHDGSGRQIFYADLEPMRKWSTETGIGIALQDDTWIFNNEKQVTLFLLRWS